MLPHNYSGYILVHYYSQPRPLYLFLLIEVTHTLEVFQFRMCMFQDIHILIYQIPSATYSQGLIIFLRQLVSLQLVWKLPLHII